MAESVYALITEAKVAPGAAPRYRSKFSSSNGNAPTGSTFGFAGTSVVLGNVAGEAELTTVHPAKKSFATFGLPVAETINPDSYMKKGHAVTVAASRTSPVRIERHTESSKKPAIPTNADKPVMGLKTDKNFVVANAVENILAVSKKQAPQPKRAVEREDFGKVPEYISGIKNELEQQYQLIDQHKAMKAADAELFHQLSANEVLELRAGLQHRWDILNKEFQTTGFSVETFTQKKRQESVEMELRCIEQALQKVRKTHIFIYENQK